MVTANPRKRQGKAFMLVHESKDLCALEVLILFLYGSMLLKKSVILFVRGDLAVLEEVRLFAVCIQTVREFGAFFVAVSGA